MSLVPEDYMKECPGVVNSTSECHSICCNTVAQQTCCSLLSCQKCLHLGLALKLRVIILMTISR